MYIYKYLLFILLLPIFSHVQADAKIPPFFQVSYSLYSNDMKIGMMERKFSMISDNNYLFRSESKTTGFFSIFRDDHIVEQSKWSYTDQGFIPQTYKYEHTGGKKDRFVDITFNWDKNRITNKVNDSTWHMDTQAGILDKLLYQLTIMADLKSGKVPENYTIADGGKIKNYYFAHVADEVIETPIGNFKAMKIERRKENSERKTWFWCAYELDFLPVKVVITEKQGRLTTAVIEEFDKQPMTSH